jgi:hypothetical protein
MLCCAGLLEWLRRRRAPFRDLAIPGAAFLAISVVLFGLGFTTSDYAEWIYDRSTKRMVNLIRQRERAHPGTEVTVASHWSFEASLGFYRTRYRLGWMKRASGEGPDRAAGYYMLREEDRPLVRKRNLTVIYSDPRAEAFLAVSRP